MDFLKKLSGQEKRVYLATSLLLAVWSAFYILKHNPELSALLPNPSPYTFTFGFLALGILAVGAVFFYTPFRPVSSWVKKLFVLFLPAETIFLAGLDYTDEVNQLFYVAAGLYVIVLGLYFSFRYLARLERDGLSHISPRAWIRLQGVCALTFVLLLTGIFAFTGSSRLGQFVAVDEALWLYGRVPKYWNALGDLELKKTAISDKPGITVAIASGAAMAKYEHPIVFKSEKGPNKGIEDFFFAFRLPLVLVAALFLPLFYFLIERLLGRTRALFSYSFVALSPVTLGMTKIINPDSFLWFFAPLTLLAYLAFLKRRHPAYLFLAGLLLGLTLLTKYVGNIVVVFIFGIIFLEYIFNDRRIGSRAFVDSIKEALVHYGVLLFSALSVFAILYPAVFLKPEKLLEATIESEAFESVAPLFLGIVFFVLADRIVTQARVTEQILAFFRRFSAVFGRVIAGIFLVSMTFTIANVWLGMRWFNFTTLLASPKTIANNTDIVGVFLTNFHPLLFGVTPIVLVSLFASAILLFRESFRETARGRLSLYLILFILLYYAGATVNGVASITRYQTILYPIAGIIAGIALGELFLLVKKRLSFPFEKRFLLPALLLIVAGAGICTLVRTPFPLSYASSLLPERYHTDVKDMGPGSYEAAMYLNTLPDAQNLTVWTDKSGVCKFFVGRCKSSFDWRLYRKESFDYIVVSAGRENRTTDRVMTAVEDLRSDVLRFDTYYDRTDGAVWELLINGRPSHYVRIFPFEQ